MRAKASVRVMAWVLPAMFALSSLAHAQVAETVTPREIRQNLFDTCFPTPTEGWVVGDLGRVFKTTDGGRTWQRQIVSGRLPFLGIVDTIDRVLQAAPDFDEPGTVEEVLAAEAWARARAQEFIAAAGEGA